jgi:large subunit ribosomal protein L22
MEVKAKVKNLRMSARKVRLVVDVVRGLKIDKALDSLNFIKKEAAKPVKKLINSGIANALNNFNLDKDNLFVKEIRVDEGSVLRRWAPKAHGRATPIRKRSCHINLILGEIKDSGEIKPKTQKAEAPIKLDHKESEDEGVKIKKAKTEEKVSKDMAAEKGKEIVDPRMEGRHGHGKMEGGGHKGFVSKMFRRKSG